MGWTRRGWGAVYVQTCFRQSEDVLYIYTFRNSKPKAKINHHVCYVINTDIHINVYITMK